MGQSWLSSLIFCILSSLIGSVAFSASIIEIEIEKNTVKIDSGKNESIRKKDRVCFYNIDGQKVTCGIVIKLSASQSSVLVGKKSIQKIKKEMEAKPVVNPAAEPVSDTVSSLSNNFRILYPFTVYPMGTYQKLAYEMPPSTSAKVTTLWKQVGTPTMIVSGFGVEGQIAFKTSALATGIKIIKYAQFSSDSFYDSDSKNAALVEQNASALGLWADLHYININKGNFGFTLGNGLEINRSSVDLTSIQTNDDSSSIENPLAKAKSDLTVLGLRTLFNVHTYVWRLGLTGGINVIIPLTGTAKFKGKVTSPHKSQIEDVELNENKPNTDLQRALAHKRSAFGLELIFSGFYSF